MTHRTPEAVTAASSNVSENDIKKWFADIEQYLRSKDYFSILEDSSRVYNGDETCFLFCPKLGKVIAPKAAKNIYEVDRGQAKQNLTVMFSFSASGSKIPPLIIFPNKRLSKAVSSSVPNDWGIASTDNGWMKAEVFIDYIKKIFYKHLIQEKVKFPVILFVDGHRTHLTFELSRVCADLKIILIALYPNATRILQPADVACFKPLKSFWKSGVLQWRRENPYCQLGKQHFAPILQKCILQLSADAITNGFRACGLYPWNTSSIDFSKCLGKNRSKDDLEVPCSSTNPSGGESTLDFKKFCDILGESSLQKLERGETNQDHHNCHYFQNLKDIYSELKPDISEKTSTDIDIVEILLEDNNNVSFTEDDIMNMPLVFGIETINEEEKDRNEALNKKYSSIDKNAAHLTDPRDHGSITLDYKTRLENKSKITILQNIVLNKNEKQNSSIEEIILNQNRNEDIEIFDEETGQECDKYNKDKARTEKKEEEDTKNESKEIEKIVERSENEERNDQRSCDKEVIQIEKRIKRENGHESTKEKNATEICNKGVEMTQSVRKSITEFLERPKTPERTGKKIDKSVLRSYLF